VFTPFVCIATIINLKFCALDVMTPCFHHFVPKFNVKNHFTINNNLRMKEGLGGERKAKRQLYFVNFTIT
jgi:hypothetical protein